MSVVLSRRLLALFVWGFVLVVGSAPSQAMAAVTKIACVGASTTSGDGSSAGHHFPDELGIALGPAYQVQNFGVSGTTMLKSGDNPYWNHPQLQQALSYDPDIAVIWFGGNDAKPQNWTGHMAQFITDYEAMVHLFQALPSHPKIFLMLSMVIHDTEGIPKVVLEQQVLPEVRQVGADTGSFIVNYHDEFIGDPQYFPDGVHPDDAGTAVIGPWVAQIILGDLDGGALDAATGALTSDAAGPPEDDVASAADAPVTLATDAASAGATGSAGADTGAAAGADAAAGTDAAAGADAGTGAGAASGANVGAGAGAGAVVSASAGTSSGRGCMAGDVPPSPSGAFGSLGLAISALLCTRRKSRRAI